MCKKIQLKDYSELYRLPIWYNPLVSTYPLILPELYKKGINQVGDLLTDNGEKITKEDLLIKTGLITINLLNYLRLKGCIKSLLNNSTFQPRILHKPLPQLLFSIATKIKKDQKTFIIFLNINRKKLPTKITYKWEDIY